MGAYVNIGNAAFARLIKGIYVDKTGLISFVNRSIDISSNLICVTRPRRFGKTLAVRMLCAYYDRTCDSRKLFEGLEVSRDPSFETHLNKYDVICLDITRFTSDAKTKHDLPNVVRRIENEVIKNLRNDFPEAEQDPSLCNTIFNIFKKTGRQFVMIIDEWDALFREAQDNLELQEEYIYFLRSLFKNSFMTEDCFAAVYMTGILPIKKYGTHSAISDFWEYTMTYPQPLEKFVGFTEEEVRRLCENSSLDFSDMQQWYDGYVVGREVHIYNPRSVKEALERGQVGNYWVRTETFESLKYYIELDVDGLLEAVVQMLVGEHIKTDVDTFQNDMRSFRSRDDVLTLLVHLGYLAYDLDQQSVFIPNEEVKSEFLQIAKEEEHCKLAKLFHNSISLLESTVDMDEERVAAVIEETHESIADPRHYNNEETLRSVIWFAYICCMDEYVKMEELPSGHGYADIVFIPKRTSARPLLVIELKWNKTAEAAIEQIKDRRYPQAVKEYGGRILLVGINYDSKTKKHTCKIEEYRK